MSEHAQTTTIVWPMASRISPTPEPAKMTTEEPNM
jgi:hypothetical protein